MTLIHGSIGGVAVTRGPDAALLSIENLQTYFYNEDGITRAVDGVSMAIYPGETVGIVGESGCGKSVTALSILRLVPNRIGRIVGGRILFEGRNLLDLSEHEMRRIRGDRIAMIFQEPMTSLNPVLTIGHQIAEAVRIHRGASAAAARARALEVLDLVRIPDARRRVDDYPHQFSGGMRQRVMIAMALACDPKLLIADEPTTALDVTIQAQVLELMLELKEQAGASVLLITHDLGVVAETCQRVVVMYAGRKVEEADVFDLFDRPAHPYTRGLLASVARGKAGGRLTEIPGMVPSLRQPISGCHFAPRCPFADDHCRSVAPVLRQIEGGGAKPHVAACHKSAEVLAS
ncbi:MAG: ABC transporter ATP-binding protein [Hyphomicrobiaceae bacterium]